MILKGIPSGDSECWCFLVDKKTFMSVLGKAPEKHDRGRFRQKGSPYQYMLYPSDLFKEQLLGDPKKAKPLIISVESVSEKGSGSAG